MKTRISSRAAKASSEARFYRTGESPCDWGFMHLESSNCPKGHIPSANVYCVPTRCPHPALCPRWAALPSARASSRPHPRSGRTRAGRLFLVGAPQRSGKRARQGSPRTGAAAAAAAPPHLRPRSCSRRTTAPPAPTGQRRGSFSPVFRDATSPSPFRARARAAPPPDWPPAPRIGPGRPTAAPPRERPLVLAHRGGARPR